MASRKSSASFALVTEHMVGREHEMDAIREAIKNHKLRVICFVGPGGIGKTRLLQEVAVLHEDPTFPSFRWSGIIDFYHSEYHSADGLEMGIIRGIDPKAECFRRYRQDRSEFEKRRAAGLPSAELAKERPKLTETFLQEYNELAAQGRIVLCLDTLERLGLETDPVQRMCRGKMEVGEAKDWLENNLKKMTNTIVLLGGRPEAILRDLRDRLGSLGFVYQEFELTGLTWEESRVYFSEMATFHPEIISSIPEDVRRRIWEYTGGHPIRLSLVIDLVLYGDISGLFPLGAADGKADKHTIDERLIRRLMEMPDPSVLEMLHYLALARKGLNAELLYHLEPTWSKEECQKNLEAMKRFTFVKPRPGTDLFFLHDELYELLDRFVLGERREYREKYRAIADYYWDLWRKVSPEERERQEDLKATLLYYELQADPWDAFWCCYIPWTERAIKAYDTALDMRLRDELLEFLSWAGRTDDIWVQERLPRDTVDQNAAVHWVTRYLSQGKSNDKARDTSRCIQDSSLPAFRADDPLFRGRLGVAYGEALLYTSAPEKEIRQVLTTAIEMLQRWFPPEVPEEASQLQEWVGLTVVPRVWLKNRGIGRAHNDLAYLFQQSGRLTMAAEQFHRAHFYFREADIRDEMADTLNNLAYLYGVWGETDRAENLIQDALNLRKEIGRSALAFSYNTRGLINIFTDRPYEATQLCKQALGIFEEFKVPRGIGLSCMALGIAYRRLGELWKTDQRTAAEAAESFLQAEVHLEQASRIFGNGGEAEQPMRMWEAQNELGSLYCDWGWLLREQGDLEPARRKYEQAIKHTTAAAKIAEQGAWLAQQLDSYDDLAQMYADLEDFPKAQSWLRIIDGKVPPEYKLVRGQGLRSIDEPINDLWLAMGKMHFQECIWAYRHWAYRQPDRKEIRSVGKRLPLEAFDKLSSEELLDEMAKNIAYAVAYFQQYSSKAPRVADATKAVYGRIKNLSTERLQKMRSKVQEVSQMYKVDSREVLRVIDDALGVPGLLS